MINYPKITIVTPSYNQGLYLEETILSIVNQKYPNLEFIIIDGGSTDNSVEIIKKYESYIHYWISEPDNGHYDAVQKGFEKSSGEIMTYINSDDLLANGCLLSVAHVFTDYEQVEWITGIPNFIDDTGKCVWVGELKQWNKYKYIGLDFRFIQQEGTFWKKNLWEKAGKHISTHFHLASDLELWSRFFMFGELYSMPIILGNFRIRKDNQKSLESYDNYLDEAIIILNKMPQEKFDKRNIAIAKTRFYRLLKKAQFKFIFNIIGFNKIEATVENYPKPISFDRELYRFLLKEK